MKPPFFQGATKLTGSLKLPSASGGAMVSSKADPNRRLGLAWLFLTVAFGLHILDEALTGFLSVYNPTVAALRAQYSWFPMPQFDFNSWLWGLICFLLVLFGLTPFFFSNMRWVRPMGYLMAVIQILNAAGHTLGTIAGQTVASVRFPRPAPGFYSSPLLLITALYLLHSLSGSNLQHRDHRAAGASQR